MGPERDLRWGGGGQQGGEERHSRGPGSASKCSSVWAELGLSFSPLNPRTLRGFFLQREEWVPGESGCGSKMELRLELGRGGKPSTPPSPSPALPQTPHASQEPPNILEQK